MIPDSYTFSCASPTKPSTQGQVGEFHVSPASSKLRSIRKNKMGYIYAISIRTPEKKKPSNSKKRKILALSPSDINRFQKVSDLQKYIDQNDAKLPKTGKTYVGLTINSPRKRLRSHKNSAAKGSQLAVHKTMREGARNGKEVSASVVACVPLPLLGPVEEVYRQKVDKENICLNMRKGGAGGGGHKLT